MQKPIYVFLLLITTLLIGYTLYYSSTHQVVAVSSVLTETASTTEAAAATTTEPDPNTLLTTQSGKTITITETNPIGQSLSTILITPLGFASDTPITLETNKLTKFFLADLNQDTYDELILITTAQGSGSYGEAIIYTTTDDRGLIPVTVPQLKEEDTKKGGLFEGYMGHDTFLIASGTILTREFPTYVASDTESMPTGPTRKVLYTLTIKGSSTPSIVFTKNSQATSTQTSSSSKQN